LAVENPILTLYSLHTPFSPQAGEWVAVLVGRVIAADASKLPLTFLTDALQPLVEDDRAASFAADVLAEFAASHLKVCRFYV
jgi:hypothetical protein